MCDQYNEKGRFIKGLMHSVIVVRDKNNPEIYSKLMQYLGKSNYYKE